MDGGSGYNSLHFSVDDHPPIDLSMFIGFSELNTGAYTSATSDVILTPADAFDDLCG